MLFLVQLALASLLIAAAATIVFLWLLLLTLSYSGQSGLMPWVAAGVVLYGLAFIALATVIGAPGILWANHLARRAPPMWRRVAKGSGWFGTAALGLGFAAAVAVLATEKLRAKDPLDGCVSYRDPAASAAMAAPGAKPEIDCPR